MGYDKQKMEKSLQLKRPLLIGEAVFEAIALRNEFAKNKNQDSSSNLATNQPQNSSKVDKIELAP